MRELALLSISHHTKFEVSSFADSKDIIRGLNLKRSRDPDHAPFRGGLSSNLPFQIT